MASSKLFGDLRFNTDHALIQKIHNRQLRNELDSVLSRRTARGYYGAHGGALGTWYYDLVAHDERRTKRYETYQNMLNDTPETMLVAESLCDAALQTEKRSVDSAGSCYAVEVTSKNQRGTKRAQAAVQAADTATRIREDIWPIAFQAVTRGDDFEEAVASPGQGITGLEYRPQESMRINWNSLGEPDPMAPYIQSLSPHAPPIATFKPWQIVHFAYRPDRRTRYGTSIFQGARATYTQMKLMEDMMVVAWVERAFVKYKWKVDTKGITDENLRQQFMETFRSQVSSTYEVDSEGRISSRFNPMTQSRDIWLPVGARGADHDVEVMGQGSAFRFDVAALKYMHDKFVVGIKGNKTMLGFPDESGRAAQEGASMGFARAIRHLQQDLKRGLDFYYRVVLAAANMDTDSVVLSYTFPFMGASDEMVRVNMRLALAQIATTLRQMLPPKFLVSKVLSPALDLSREEASSVTEYLEEHPELMGEPPKFAGSKVPFRVNKKGTEGVPSRPGSTGKSGSKGGSARGMNPGHESQTMADEMLADATIQESCAIVGRMVPLLRTLQAYGGGNNTYTTDLGQKPRFKIWEA